MTKTLNFNTEVDYRDKLPFFKMDPESHFLVFDLNLLVDNEEVEEFIQSFPNRYGIKGGELVKDFKKLPDHIDNIMKKWPGAMSRNHTLVTLGGGSIGDFGGFMASILKRGLGLVHIPTTWLSAMDSAHGGKTALNLYGVKNQIGTFYPAGKVYIVRSLLQQLEERFADQAFGELIKMALIGESQFFKDLVGADLTGKDLLWSFLKPCVEDKYKVILQDPFERKEIRQILNFGHTMGHVFESFYSWPHGDSVLQGIFFALDWSLHRGDLDPKIYNEIMESLTQKMDRIPAYQLKWYKAPKAKAFEKLLKADKKIDEQGRIQFVFLKGIGQPFLQPVLVDDLLVEVQRQGWVK